MLGQFFSFILCVYVHFQKDVENCKITEKHPFSKPSHNKHSYFPKIKRCHSPSRDTHILSDQIGKNMSYHRMILRHLFDVLPTTQPWGNLVLPDSAPQTRLMDFSIFLCLLESYQFTVSRLQEKSLPFTVPSSPKTKNRSFLHLSE